MLLINNLLSQLAKICIQWRYFRDFCWWFFVCIEASRATRTHKSDTTQWFWLRSICYSNDGHERGTKQNKYSEFDSSRTATERESVMVMGDTLFLFTIPVDYAVLHEMHEKNKNAYIVYTCRIAWFTKLKINGKYGLFAYAANHLFLCISMKIYFNLCINAQKKSADEYFQRTNSIHSKLHTKYYSRIVS